MKCKTCPTCNGVIYYNEEAMKCKGFNKERILTTLNKRIDIYQSALDVCFYKNEAQRVLRLSEKRKQTAEAEGRIVIPMNLPQPLEEAGADEMIATELAAVDQEIEKLLDFSSLDFIESPMKTNEEDQENDLATSIESENFLDENPIRGQNA